MAIDLVFVLIAIGIFTDMMDVVILAMGFQNVATLWKLVFYWEVMTPFAYLFAFCFDLGFIWVWIGLPKKASWIYLPFCEFCNSRLETPHRRGVEKQGQLISGYSFTRNLINNSINKILNKLFITKFVK